MPLGSPSEVSVAGWGGGGTATTFPLPTPRTNWLGRSSIAPARVRSRSAAARQVKCGSQVRSVVQAMAIWSAKRLMREEEFAPFKSRYEAREVDPEVAREWAQPVEGHSA